MAFSVEEVEEGVLQTLRDEFEPYYNVYDDYIPNTTTLRRNGSEVENYIVVQFGDLQPQSAYAMTGPWDDDYGLPIYIQAISASPSIARQIARKVVRVLLSKSYPWSGEIRKKAGFNQFTIDSSDYSVEAYASPVFFTVPVQMSNEA